MKRTKGGLLPWWVRKRLQEHSEPDQKGTSTVQQNPVKAKKKTPNILEVSKLCIAQFHLPCVTKTYFSGTAIWDRPHRRLTVGFVCLGG